MIAKELFLNHVKALFQPGFRILLTLPIAAIRDVTLMTVLESETNNQIVTMPVSKLFHRGESRLANAVPNPEVLQNLITILNKRIDAQLAEPETLEQIAIYSGGVLRELIRIANECCRICLRLVRREPDNLSIKINDSILQEAILKLSLDFDTRIGQKDYEILTTVYQNFKPKDPKQQEFLDLLHGLYILEYRNQELWYDLHPMVRDLLTQKGII